MTEKEKKYLRELAKKQEEYSKLPVMEERKKQWFNINTGKRDYTPVIIETGTFIQDIMPDGICTCESGEARHIEFNLLKTIREHEFINDDKVMPDFYPIRWNVGIDEFGVKINQTHATDSQGRNVGYQFEHPIKDLEKDFHLLKEAKLTLYKDETLKYRDFLQETIGDILPVVFDSRPPTVSFTQKVIRLFGMEAFFIAMHEEPDLLKKLMEYLTKNYIRIIKFYEENGLLTINNGNQESCASSYTFTDRLPSPGFDGKNVRLKDVWIWMESQETVGVSPAMFKEFCLPYYAEAAKMFGLLYYGCCEPVHFFWNDLISAMPNIKKVSVSPWCDEEYMGEVLSGSGVVYSRKPAPGYLGVDEVLDEEGWRAHIRKTLDAAKNCQCEIIMRDIYKVGDLSRAKRAVEIARCEAQKKNG